MALLMLGLLLPAFAQGAAAQATPEVEPTATQPAPTETPIPTIVDPTAVPTEAPTGNATPDAEAPIPASGTPEAIAPAGIMAAGDAPATTGTVTKTASSTTPTWGQPVHFTITISGTAPAGVILNLTDTYIDSSVISVVGDPDAGAYAPVATENLDIVNQSYSGADAAYAFTREVRVQQEGPYSATFQVTVTLGYPLPLGTVVPTDAILATLTEDLDTSTLALIVDQPAAMGSVNVSANTTNPQAGQQVTITIDVWGSAASEAPVGFSGRFPRPALAIAEQPPNLAFTLVSADGAQVGDIDVRAWPNTYDFSGSMVAEGVFRVTYQATIQVSRGNMPGAVISIDVYPILPGEEVPPSPATLSLTVAENDLDGDLVSDGEDNCVDTHNPDQADQDGDGMGDACDPDTATPIPTATSPGDPAPTATPPGPTAAAATTPEAVTQLPVTGSGGGGGMFAVAALLAAITLAGLGLVSRSRISRR